MEPDNLMTSDEELARQSQAGSMAAFEELVRRYERRIYTFAARCGGAGDASEVTQDTFVRAYEALGDFDARRSFGAWLFTIARRKCIDRHRLSGPVLVEVPELVELDNPAEQLAREEDEAAIWNRAARLLPPPQYEALWLRYAEEMSVVEISRVLRKTKTHVKVLLFRARKTLIRHLGAKARRGAPVPAAQPLGLAIPGREQSL